MKRVILFLVFLSSALGQAGHGSEKTGSDRLRIELRASPSRVRMTEDVALTVFFAVLRKGSLSGTRLGGVLRRAYTYASWTPQGVKLRMTSSPFTILCPQTKPGKTP